MGIKITERLLKYEWMYVSTEIAKLWNFSGRPQLLVLNTFTFDTKEFCLDVNYKVNDARALKNFYYHPVSFDSSDLILHIRIGLVSLGKSQQTFKIKPVILKSGTPRVSLKRIPVGVEHSNCPKPQHL